MVLDHSLFLMFCQFLADIDIFHDQSSAGRFHLHSEFGSEVELSAERLATWGATSFDRLEPPAPKLVQMKTVTRP